MTINLIALNVSKNSAKSITIFQSSTTEVVRVFLFDVVAGQNKITINGLSNSTDKESARISVVPGDARLLDLVCSIDQSVLRDNSTSDVNRLLALQKNALEDEHKSRQQELSVLEEYARTLKAEHVSPEKMADFLDSYMERRRTISKAVRELEEKIAEANKAMWAKSDRMAAAFGKITAVLNAKDDCHVELKLTYHYWRGLDRSSDDSGEESERSDQGNVSPPENKISFLLLERLGEPLTMGVDYSENKDLWQTFHDLSHMGVEHRDIRYANILCAPLAPPGFRGAKCPYHKRMHKFRIIDFDRWVKSDYNMEGHERTTVCSMGGLLEGISKGYKVEPWATWRLFSRQISVSALSIGYLWAFDYLRIFCLLEPIVRFFCNPDSADIDDKKLLGL
ncbi:hypothetical protein A0H81_07410 [Grifola frondosa]|uniref:DUF4140 domain-containing protein n=1 Tax=Grifola frondosa TaxID=5627 RepID=A0A1C7M698_GRIFR|nr:hypothetical protein A0H81_07410 [Grifola frondosa]